MERVAGVTAISVHFPDEVRANDWWREHHPEVVADAEARTLARVFSRQERPATIFDRAMQPYTDDPFRGARLRRVSGDEDSVSMECKAARKVLDAADLSPDGIDLLISTGFVPRDPEVGNAVHVAGALGLTGAAWNLESACGGPLNAMITASALVNAGQHRRVLVTTSCSYLSHALPSDPVSWFLGDGAGAFIVSEGGASFLGGHARHTAETCGTWYHRYEDGRLRMGANPKTGRVMRATAEPQLRACTAGALERAGLSLSDIDFFVFHTPTAWFAQFAAEALGISLDRTVSTYEEYANVGPALTTTNLHRAASLGRLSPGDRVLVFGPGSSASSAAVVLRWGDVALSAGPAAHA